VPQINNDQNEKEFSPRKNTKRNGWKQQSDSKRILATD